MEPLGIARRLAELGKKPEACRAYGVALQKQALSPLEQFEAASYIFFAEGDYKIAFTAFVSLYNQGHFQSEGRSSHRVPGAIPASGIPLASS